MLSYMLSFIIFYNPSIIQLLIGYKISNLAFWLSLYLHIAIVSEMGEEVGNLNKNRDNAVIGLGVAIIIGGGFAIFILSSAFPIPGVRYIFMSPFISTTLYIITSKVENKHTLVWVPYLL